MQHILLFPDDQLNTSSPGYYIALQTTFISREALRALTPQFMQWNEDIWILNLSSCLNYWNLQAKIHQQTLNEHLQMRISDLHDTATSAARQASKKLEQPHQDEHRNQFTYTAASSHDPWLAILLVQNLGKNGFLGLTASNSRIGKNLLSSISWDIWWMNCDCYVKHSLHKKKFAIFSRQKRAMQLAMKRLSLHTPLQAKGIPQSQIKRRFGSILAELWDITFSTSLNSLEKINNWGEMVPFPWSYVPYIEPIKIKRHLDGVLSNWNDIEEFLRIDLNGLCFLESFKKQERILSMEWRIVLCDFQEMLLPILFRHPHCLQQESPHQRTALLQISYAFQNYILKNRQHKKDPYGIVSWEIVVRETFQSQVSTPGLFDQGQPDTEQLMHLENQLEQPLESYQIVCNWVPEDAFRIQQSHDTIATEDNFSLKIVGKNRPLFLLKDLCNFEDDGQIRVWKFCERTMDKWWQNQHMNTARDYYQVLNNDRLNWVFRDNKNRIFIHGIYG